MRRSSSPSRPSIQLHDRQQERRVDLRLRDRPAGPLPAGRGPGRGPQRAQGGAGHRAGHAGRDVQPDLRHDGHRLRRPRRRRRHRAGRAVAALESCGTDAAPKVSLPSKQRRSKTAVVREDSMQGDGTAALAAAHRVLGAARRRHEPDRRGGDLLPDVRRRLPDHRAHRLQHRDPRLHRLHGAGERAVRLPRHLLCPAGRRPYPHGPAAARLLAALPVGDGAVLPSWWRW